MVAAWLSRHLNTRAAKLYRDWLLLETRVRLYRLLHYCTFKFWLFSWLFILLKKGFLLAPWRSSNKTKFKTLFWAERTYRWYKPRNIKLSQLFRKFCWFPKFSDNQVLNIWLARGHFDVSTARANVALDWPKKVKTNEMGGRHSQNRQKYCTYSEIRRSGKIT